MSIKKLSLKATPAFERMRLDQVLASWLPEASGMELSKGKIRKLIIAGAVQLNGRRIRIASKPVRAGAKIDVFLDPKKASGERPILTTPVEVTTTDILFEDEHLLIANKPAGIPTQPTLDQSRDHYFGAVKRFLAQRDRVHDPYLGLHHRLDRDTSGLILFTKTKQANPGVAKLFQEHQIQKTYLAVTRRPKNWRSSQEWTIQNFLGVDKKQKGKRKRFTSVQSGGQPAETHFKLVQEFPHAILLEASPQTGRTHQIRVHCFESQMGILGDPIYKEKKPDADPKEKNLEVSVPRLMLHAARLTFIHPIRDTEVEVHCSVPSDFLACLDKLKKTQT